jgi:uncharacterized repeat protein (TIGR01451 family)
MTNINKIPLIFLLIIIFSCVSAVNAENPEQITTNNSSFTAPLDPTMLFSGSLSLATSETTAHVNDTVQIYVTLTNTGLVKWNHLSIYIPLPNGTQFVSFIVPDRNLQNYNPKFWCMEHARYGLLSERSTKNWNFNC